MTSNDKTNLPPVTYPDELGFLQTHIQKIDRHQEAVSSPFATATEEHQKEQGRIFFRQGYKTSDSLTRKLFIVLRGLPGCGAGGFAKGIMEDAVSKRVRTMALLSTEDFFYNANGEYVFNKDLLPEYHERNYKRAVQHFVIGTELVILNNYNIRKSHYKHYVTVAMSLGYVIAEMNVGTRNPTEEEIKVYARNTEGRVPVSVIRNYASSYEY